jgi:hypothetical protein
MDTDSALVITAAHRYLHSLAPSQHNMTPARPNAETFEPTARDLLDLTEDLGREPSREEIEAFTAACRKTLRALIGQDMRN